MSNAAACAGFWLRNFPEQACAPGLEVQAQQCERLRQAQTDQAMADHIAHSRAVYEHEMERTSAWQEMGVLARMAHEPMSPQQIAASRRRYGISE